MKILLLLLCSVSNPTPNKRWDKANTPRNFVVHTVFDSLTGGGIAKGEMVYVGKHLGMFTKQLSNNPHVVLILRVGDKWAWQTNRGVRYFDCLQIIGEYIKAEGKVAVIMSNTPQDVSACDFIIKIEGKYIYLEKNNFGPTVKGLIVPRER